MDLSNYKLVWEDNFDYEGSPDPDKWTFEVGNHQWPNRELQAYTSLPENVSVHDGNLVIRAIKKKDGEREYTSAKINTSGKQSWQYGYFEFRVKLPKGLGSWPAIWMMPDVKFPEMPDWVPTLPNGRPDFAKLTTEQRKALPPIPAELRWPNCGEIDIIEHVGRLENNLLFSLHSKNHNHADKSTVPYTTRVAFEEDLWADYHIYAFEWTEEYIEYFVDGKSYCRYNKSDDKLDQSHDSWPFDKPYYLIMNIAVGGGLGGPVTDEHLPFEMYVDYARVYQKIK